MSVTFYRTNTLGFHNSKFLNFVQSSYSDSSVKRINRLENEYVHVYAIKFHCVVLKFCQSLDLLVVKKIYYLKK